MKTTKPFKDDIIFIICGLLLCSTLGWEWTNIKSFVAGGVISYLATRRWMRKEV